jgi:hypothetical protein
VHLHDVMRNDISELEPNVNSVAELSQVISVAKQLVVTCRIVTAGIVFQTWTDVPDGIH